MRRIILRLALLAFLLTFAQTTWAKHDDSADDFSSDVASVWFDTLYDVIKSEGTSPPPASRIYGIAAVALYESIVRGTKSHKSLSDQLNDLESLRNPGRTKNITGPS